MIDFCTADIGVIRHNEYNFSAFFAVKYLAFF